MFVMYENIGQWGKQNSGWRVW